MRSKWAAIALALVVGVSGCGGGADNGVMEPAVTVAPTVVPTPTAADQLAFVETSLEIAGVPDLFVRPGETVSLDFLVHNDAAGISVVAFRVDASDLFDSDLSVSSLRMSGRKPAAVSVEVRVSDDVQIGDVVPVSLLGVLQSDTDQRARFTTNLTVVEVAAERPDVTPNHAVTNVNQRVVILVTANDSGERFDYTTLRIVAGPFRSKEAGLAGGGFISYEPFLNLTGDDLLMYELCNMDGLCDTAVVTFGVTEE